jgi:hypothetical protein
LARLFCEGNQLSTLDISNNTALTDLRCQNNQLSVLDPSNNTELKTLHCWNNMLAELDVSKNINLYELYCSNNRLTALDVSKNTALLGFECAKNQLKTLDVSHNTALAFFDCAGNELNVLDISKNTALLRLYCQDNQLTELDVAKMMWLAPLVGGLHCYNNFMTSPDSVKGWKELGLVINSSANPESGSFRYYNQKIIIDKFITVSFTGVKNATVQYYTNIAGWVTVGKFDDVCVFTIPDDLRATFGDSLIRVQKEGMVYNFNGLKVGDEPLFLDVPVKAITIAGIAAECSLAIVQDTWVYPYAPAIAGVTNEFMVFDNSKKYEVRLSKNGYYPITIPNIDAGQTVFFGPSYFYQAVVPVGMTNVWISSNDWAVRGANAGDKIILLADPTNIRSGQLRYDYGGKTYSVEFKLNGSNPFEGLI